MLTPTIRRARLILLTMALVGAGCGGESATHNANADTAISDTAISDTAQVADAADTSTDGAAVVDASDNDADGANDASAVADAAPPFDCPGSCNVFAVCGVAFPHSLCMELCTGADSAAPAQKCLSTQADCDGLTNCMSTASQPAKKPLRTFDDGNEGYGYRDLAGDFTVETLLGPWNFKAHYDGNDSYVFLTVGAGLYTLTGGGDYLTWVWNSANQNDIKQLMAWSPPNVHYFFAAYRDADGTDNSAKYIKQMHALFEPHLAKLKPLERMAWRSRLHFVTTLLPWAKYPDESKAGWLGAFTKKTPRVAFAIDRFQRLRQVGLLRIVGNDSKAFVHHLAWEARYYNYEFKRAEQHPETGDVKIVTVYDAKTVNGETFEFDLPPAAELAQYDSLEVDIAQMCKNHDDTNCFEWDYNAHLQVIERHADPSGDETIEASCNPAVAGVVEQAEVLGACKLAGEVTGTTCKAHCDCEAVHGVGATCVGYKPAQKAVAKVAADTKACECISPRQENVARERTCTWLKAEVADAAGYCQLAGKNTYCQACTTDADCGGEKDACKAAKVAQTASSGWSKCGCKTQFIQRWITSYHREGRWIADSARARYYLANGGKVRFNFKGSYPYVTTMKLRYLKKNVLPPIGLQHLFSGGGYGADYNDKYLPISVTIPKTAKKVEIGVEATGHGFGSGPNCAEFCDHTHHFTVKSSKGEKTWVHDNPWIGNNYGCAEQVDDGAVPNQFGTWYLGRGGWCPGMDVKVVTWDITDQVSPGETVTISYKSLFAGQPMGAGGNINLDSWVVFR